MRCKKHYDDLSSNAGVCASCLRERLFSLILAQEQQAHAQILDCRSDAHPAFPRSVSPYVSRRKSDRSADSHAARDGSLSDQRFYSTPQVGPTAGGYHVSGDLYRRKKNSCIRFSLFSNLFRSKNRKGTESDPRVSNSRESCGGGGSGNVTSAMSSPAWLSNMMSGGDRLKKQPCCLDESTTAGAGVMRKHRCRDRGMSPVRYSDADGVDELRDRSSSYESSESWKQTPRRTPIVRRGGAGGHGMNVSGLTFYLNPLVRARPNRHWNQKGMPPADGVFSGEIRAPEKHHLSNTKSFCANRSRKLADFGRLNRNR